MSKTINYKTLRGILNQSSNKTLSVSDVICGRFFHKKLGFVSFRLSDDALRLFVDGICSRLGMRDRETIYNNLRHHRVEDCYILKGLIVRYEKGSGLFCNYYSEQDYIAEAKIVRKLLRCN